MLNKESIFLIDESVSQAHSDWSGIGLPNVSLEMTVLVLVVWLLSVGLGKLTWPARELL